ncbi:hypothetical protein glysoja_037881 [Glycine soja]|uniref:Uncharacterized protein n=1 Tax=Glycine soja TaxID=3848 RepID=A0A0B2SB96_GLYSO|nr:hypothetical protein glysoja_037881 [Glycine soja]
MDRKQGFFSALKDEVVHGISPAWSRCIAHILAAPLSQFV